MFHPLVTVHRLKGQVEYRRADQDEDNERRELGGRVHRLLQQRPAQSPARERHDQRPECAHRAALGGLAMPRKMVPSTRKISASGGISTKVTRSAIFDSRLSRRKRLAIAATNAIPSENIIDKMTSSSTPAVGNLLLYQLSNPYAVPTESSASTVSDVIPLEPSFSRKVRASGGSAGTSFGRNTASN